MTATTAGAVAFARYAYPPNALGYCGPDADGELFERAHAGVSDGDLRALAHDFEGAWPYLEVLAGAVGVDDPLDARVVAGYWLGAPPADRVALADLGASIEERFRRRAGTGWDRLRRALVPGAPLCHATHVLCVSPWVGLLRAGVVDQPLEVVDRCRIRWARVVAVDGDDATVATRPVVLDGGRLALGDPVEEQVRHAHAGASLGTPPRPGDVVACHWGWVCDVLDDREVAWLIRSTSTAMALANRQLGAEAPAAGA